MQSFLITILIISTIVIFCLYSQEKDKNKEKEKINEKARAENLKIENEKIKLQAENEVLLEKQKGLNTYYLEKQEELKRIQETIDDANEVSRKAFLNYSDVLEQQYQEKEKEYDAAVDLLDKSYADIQTDILSQIDSVRKDLDKISQTRAAAYKAQLREEEIQQQSEFYSLSIDDVDKREVKVLQGVEKELRDPRPIRMII